MLSLHNISKVFSGDENGLAAVPAVDDISLEVRAGEFFSIIGPSGCGKSTLLRIVGGLIPATGGELTVAGETVKGPHRSIAMVFQEESTFPGARLGNVEFGLKCAALPRPSGEKRRNDSSHRPGRIRAPLSPSFPAACASASPSPGRSFSNRRFC
jgi:NitT/TauT family transport system ATP-binding protein